MFSSPFGFHGGHLLFLILENGVAGRGAQFTVRSSQTGACGGKFAHFMGLDLLVQRFGGRAFASFKVGFGTESFQTAAVFAAFTTPMVTPVFL